MIEAMEKIIDELIAELTPLTFRSPVTHVYNPLIYARKAHSQYLSQYGRSGIEVMLVGMNPGPWGMAQTGVPFGDIGFVKEWMQIDAKVGVPDAMHPKRPVLGFGCNRGEVSGRRLWGWAQKRFKTPDTFFKRFWVANYCPLVFMEKSGRNRTPDKLPKAEKSRLFAACDVALKKSVHCFNPRYVIGVGNFAAQRSQAALADMDLEVATVTHPSPANPRANQGWDKWMDKVLKDLGIM